MYVDGNTGSMLVQFAVAGAATAGVVGTAAWRKVTSPVRRAKKADQTMENPLDAKPEQQ